MAESTMSQLATSPHPSPRNGQKYSPSSEKESCLKKPRPRIAIVVGYGWGVRNYLLSDTLEVLRRHFDPIIISNFEQLSDFKDFYTNQGIPVYSLASKEESLNKSWDHWLVTGYLARSKSLGHSRKLQSVLEQREKKNFRTWIIQNFARYLYPWIRAYCCDLNIAQWRPIKKYRELFAQLEIQALFSTNLTNPPEWGPALAAYSEGIPIIAAVNSWDNPTTKKFPLCDYDAYLAWSEAMRTELCDFMSIKDASRIHVVGAPQFDYYFDSRYQLGREEFFSQYGLDPSRKLIVYTTVSPGFVPDNVDIIRQIFDTLCGEEFPEKPQLLVRLHPKDSLESYESLHKDPTRSNIVWTLAGVPRIQGRDQWCPTHEDLVRAVNTVRHGDVNVHAGYSTMMLDFAALDKPVVLIGYDSKGNPVHQNYMDRYQHLHPVIESGAVHVALTHHEFIKYLRDALDNPAAKRKQRTEIVNFELGQVDGSCGERAADAIVQVVNELSQKPDRGSLKFRRFLFRQISVFLYWIFEFPSQQLRNFI